MTWKLFLIISTKKKILMKKIIKSVEEMTYLLFKRNSLNKKSCNIFLSFLINHLDCVGIIKFFSVGNSQKLLDFLYMIFFVTYKIDEQIIC